MLFIGRHLLKALALKALLLGDFGLGRLPRRVLPRQQVPDGPIEFGVAGFKIANALAVGLAARAPSCRRLYLLRRCRRFATPFIITFRDFLGIDYLVTEVVYRQIIGCRIAILRAIRWQIGHLASRVSVARAAGAVRTRRSRYRLITQLPNMSRNKLN
jgi:hypothetical protein